MTTQLFVAFDDLKEGTPEFLAYMYDLSASGEPFSIKFNLDAVFKVGLPFADLVAILKNRGRPVFADLKMWNGSRTMGDIVKKLVALSVDFVNVWAFADKELAKAVKAAEGSNTKVLGLTVLSHYDDLYCQKWFRRTLVEAVTDFSRFALEAGCNGIIVPAAMLDAVKDFNAIKVATGVRPEWYKDDRHAQEATPAQVAKGGADFAVCGSPILDQPTKEEKVAALRRILEEMRQSAA